MADTKATLTWLLRDEVTATAKKVDNELKKVGRTAEAGKGGLAGMASGLVGMVSPAGLAVAAVGGVSALLLDFTHKAEETQVVTARLDAALKANVKGWDGNKDAIERNIDAGVAKGFQDRELQASFAQLVTATHDVAAAQRAQSDAEDLARLKGISLQEATDAITKVEGGRFRLLASLGIVLKKHATIQEALTAVEHAAAGQAAAYGTTVSGAMAKINAKMDQAQEKIGKALLPVFEALASFLADQLIPAVEQVVAVIQKFVTQIQNNKDVMAALSNIADAIGIGFKLAAYYIGKATDALARLIDLIAKNSTALSFIGKLATGSGAGDVAANIVGSGHAAGGWVGLHGPELALVGEKGPEYVSPARQSAPGGGFTIIGVSEAQLVAMVDRGLYFKLSRASGSAMRK